MFYIDEATEELIENPDLELGEIETKPIKVWYRYVIDKPAEYEEVIIAEYPETGGMDIGQQLVVPEEGHWEMIDSEGKVLPYDITINTDGLPKNANTPDIIEVSVYHKYTPEELEAIEEQRKKDEEVAKEAEEKQKVMDAIPGRVEELESAQDDVILLLADIVGGAA